MSNELTGTELAAITPEVWRGEILSARYSLAVGDQVCYTEFPEVKNKGDIVHLAVFPRLSVNAVGSGGTVTNQAVTLTDNSITINNWMEATVEVVDNAGFQSMLGDSTVMARKFAEQFAPRLVERQDNDIFALYASLTGTQQGDGTGEMGPALIRMGMQALDTARIPKAKRSLVLHPKSYWELFGDQQFSLAHMTGLLRGVQVAGPDMLPTVYGIKYFESPEVNTTGGLRNLLIHKEAIASVTQKNAKVVPLAKIQLSTRITGHILYEPAVIRAEHGLQIFTAP